MMFVFLIVILLIAALLEYLSLRGGAACVDADFVLSAQASEPDAPVTLTTTVRNGGRLPISYLTLRIAFPLCTVFPEGARVQRDRYGCSLTGVYRLWGRQTLQRSMDFRIAKRGVHTLSCPAATFSACGPSRSICRSTARCWSIRSVWRTAHCPRRWGATAAS